MTETRRYLFNPPPKTNCPASQSALLPTSQAYANHNDEDSRRMPRNTSHISWPSPFDSICPSVRPAPQSSRALKDITHPSCHTQPQYGPPIRPKRHASHFPRIHTRPLPKNVFLQTCIDWTTTWTSNATLLALLPHRPLFPALLRTLSSFRSVGYRISRLLFIHKRRLANAPCVGVCVCTYCTRTNPCWVDWDDARDFTKMCLDTEAKLAQELALLKYVKPYVDDQLAYYMINLAAGTRPILMDSGTAEEALYSFDQWWRCTTVDMVTNLENLIEKLKARTSELGQVETKDIVMEYSAVKDDDCTDTPTQSLKQELDRVRCSSPMNEGNDDDKSSCDTIILYPQPGEEGLYDKSIFRGRRLFQRTRECADDGMEVPIVLDVIQEMGPQAEKKLQDAFDPADIANVSRDKDKRVISGTVWWKDPSNKRWRVLQEHEWS